MTEYKYTLSVNTIKSILREEHERFVGIIFSRLVYPFEYVNCGLDLILRDLEDCKTYEDLENFIRETRKMHLQEWIDSL